MSCRGRNFEFCSAFRDIGRKRYVTSLFLHWMNFWIALWTKSVKYCFSKITFWNYIIQLRSDVTIFVVCQLDIKNELHPKQFRNWKVIFGSADNPCSINRYIFALWFEDSKYSFDGRTLDYIKLCFKRCKWNCNESPQIAV